MTVAADMIRNRRHAFALPGGSHDRLVGWLNRALPAAIGAIAAVMLLSPLSPRSEVSFLLDRNDVAITGERLRVDNATYRGEDSKGRPFSLTAGSAVQKSASQPVVDMDRLVARLLLSDGPAELTAPHGTYDFDAEKVDVRGLVDFRAADGYHLVANGVMIDLANRRVAGMAGVTGAIPAGTFRSDRIFLDLDERVVTLDGNARMQMQPGKLRIPR